MKSYDVVIVGGGPGGLSAALTLGRGRASALLVDGGTPRNARAHQVHNFVTRDGTPAAEFRAIARSQLASYPSIEARDGVVATVTPLSASDQDGLRFEVTLEDGTSAQARRVLLATGMRDVLPELPGLADLWGTSVFQCPYCHGWELRDRPWGALVASDAMVPFAAMLTAWSSGVTAFTNGLTLSAESKETLKRSGVAVEEEPVSRLLGAPDALQARGEREHETQLAPGERY
jgi:thioredoxin reductase